MSSAAALVVPESTEPSSIFETEPPRAQRGYRQRFLLPIANGFLAVRAEQVTWIEADGNYSAIHVNASRYRLRSTISCLELEMDPSRFCRIHRSIIVNLDTIREVQPWFSGDALLILHDGTRLRLSRTRRREFNAQFGGSAEFAEAEESR